MTNKSSLTVWFSLFILAVLVIGCTPAPVAEPAPAPTLDMNVVRTEVAQIVYTELTAQAAANPTDEPEQVETPVQADQPTETAMVEEAPTAIPTFTVAPTATAKPVVSAPKAAPTQNTYTDQATLISMRPANWTFMEPYEGFDAVWVVKNTGKRDWNGEFYFKGVDLDGNEFGPTYLPNSNLSVNDTVELVVDMVAPAYVAGGKNTHTAYLYIVNDDGVSFFATSLSITVQE